MYALPRSTGLKAPFGLTSEESEVAQKTSSKLPSGATIRVADPGQCFQLRRRSGLSVQVRHCTRSPAKTAFSEPGPRVIEVWAGDEFPVSQDGCNYRTWHTPLGRGVSMAQQSVECS